MSHRQQLLSDLPPPRRELLDNIMGGADPKLWDYKLLLPILGDKLRFDAGGKDSASRFKVVVAMALNDDPVKMVEWFVKGPPGYLADCDSWADVKQILIDLFCGEHDSYSLTLVSPAVIKLQLKMHEMAGLTQTMPLDSHSVPLGELGYTSTRPPLFLRNQSVGQVRNASGLGQHHLALWENYHGDPPLYEFVKKTFVDVPMKTLNGPPFLEENWDPIETKWENGVAVEWGAYPKYRKPVWLTTPRFQMGLAIHLAKHLASQTWNKGVADGRVSAEALRERLVTAFIEERDRLEKKFLTPPHQTLQLVGVKEVRVLPQRKPTPFVFNTSPWKWDTERGGAIERDLGTFGPPPKLPEEIVKDVNERKGEKRALEEACEDLDLKDIQELFGMC